jgi:hypothetical protein
MINFLVNLFGGIIFLFIFWKKLRDDYSSQIIFSTGIYILLGILLGSALAARIFPIWFFWGGFFGACLGLGFGILRFKVKFYETLEASVVALLPAVSLIFIQDSVTNSSLVSFIAFVVCLFLIFIYLFLEMRYRDFAWYGSGKIGFAGLSTLGLFFLTRSVVAIFFHDVLSFVGRSEIFVSGALALLCFLMVFNLGRK